MWASAVVRAKEMCEINLILFDVGREYWLTIYLLMQQTRFVNIIYISFEKFFNKIIDL